MQTQNTKKLKTATDFIEAAKKHRLGQWNANKCQLCDYQCSFIFPDRKVVFYDPGCNCGKKFAYELSSWSDIAVYYNSITDKEEIHQMNVYWHFEKQ